MDIFKMALVLIYPDGYVDYVPIKEGISSHVKYFYEYLKVSPRFQGIVRNNRFKFDWINEDNCNPICKLLAKNGVILFFNTAVVYILMNMDNAKSLSYFGISFPNDYHDHKGIPFVKEMIKRLDSNRYEMDKFCPDWNDFEEFDTEEYEKFLEENIVKKGEMKI